VAQADQTTVIQGWIDRLRAGDDSARAALLDCACARLARLARKMLKGYPGVGRWEQTDDVLQNALMRLDRAIESAPPTTARDFFRLAAALIRRELIDMARHYFGPQGPGAHHSTRATAEGSGVAPAGRYEPSDATHDPARLVAWTEFHRKVEGLADEDRELFDLLWYQGLTQAEAAHILDVAERTVSRRWIAVRLKLSDVLGGQPPA
jgi:RNA polymerase sigma-70 factor (ECF subfamily)